MIVHRTFADADLDHLVYNSYLLALKQHAVVAIYLKVLISLMMNHEIQWRFHTEIPHKNQKKTLFFNKLYLIFRWRRLKYTGGFCLIF